jgi:hypothetical protein
LVNRAHCPSTVGPPNTKISGEPPF